MKPTAADITFLKHNFGPVIFLFKNLSWFFLIAHVYIWITVAYMPFLQMTSLFCGASYQTSPLFLCRLSIFSYPHYLSTDLTHIMLFIFFSVTSFWSLCVEHPSQFSINLQVFNTRHRWDPLILWNLWLTLLLSCHSLWIYLLLLKCVIVFLSVL